MTRSFEHAAGLLAAIIAVVCAASTDAPATLPSDRLLTMLQHYVSGSLAHAFVLIAFLGTGAIYTDADWGEPGARYRWLLAAAGFGAAAAWMLPLAHSRLLPGA
jgi:type IV secretory pathway VirB2 component (pilin)